MQKKQFWQGRYNPVSQAFSWCIAPWTTSNRKVLSALLFLFIFFSSNAQNLVPNPSFETANCPTGYTGAPGQIATFIPQWYSANCASPDPMTGCSNHNNTRVPNILFGYQHARTGTNFMGVGFYGGWYEYLGSRLTAPLKAGREYEVSFYVSCADAATHASDALGIYFSKTEIRCISGFSGPVLPYTPQVRQKAGVFNSDTSGWELVTGKFRATGGEEYLVFGSFENWNVADLLPLGPSGTRCYYYLDDVSVTEIVPDVNDVAMNRILSPASWSVGSNTLQVEASNFGTDSVNIVDFGYQLDNNTPVIVTGVTLSKKYGIGENFTYTFPLGITLPAAGSYQLKAWVRNPGGVGNDENPANDTLHFSACTGISGFYTINTSGSGPNNFNSFTQAVAKLVSCGITGPVHFDVAAGNYNERIEIPFISGASAVNTITFKGSDTAACRLYYSSTPSGGNTFVLKLNGASHLKWQNITFENTTATLTLWHYTTWLTNGAGFNTFEGCKFVSPVSNNSVGFAICGKSIDVATMAEGNSLTGCRLVKGYYPVLYNVSHAGSGNTFTGNRIEEFGYMGLNASSAIGITFTDNYIVQSTTTGYCGVYIKGQSDYRVERNTIIAPQIGLYVETSASLGNTHIIANNMIYNVATNSTYGIYGYALGDILHNTVYSAGSYACYFRGGSNSTVANNHFVNVKAAGLAFFSAPAYHSFCDYNNYHTQGTAFVNFGVAYSSLGTLKKGNTSFNQNCVNHLPAFVNTSGTNVDLRLSNTISLRGTDAFLNTVPHDIDGNLRCTVAPSLGAHESLYNSGIPVAGFVIPDTIYIGSPVELVNLNDVSTSFKNRWYVNDSLVSTATDLHYTFADTAMYGVKLYSLSCFGADSVVNRLFPVEPLMIPAPDFISDKNEVKMNEPVQFTYLSTRGSIRWRWSVSPDTGFAFINGTDSHSKNPEMKFTIPGKYTICLTDSNSLGSNTLCKKSYIRVKDELSICTASESRHTSGILYDNGGPAGNHGSNYTIPCHFLIDPCAKAVNVRFSQFSLSANAYLRVYDGTDNSGIPLHTGSGFTGGAIPGGIDGLTANSGKMYFEFVSGPTTSAGFTANWTSVKGDYQPITGEILLPDTLYNCSEMFDFTFESKTSTFVKEKAHFKWWFDYADNIPEDKHAVGEYTSQWLYSFPGTRIIRMDVEDCGGKLTKYDTLTVVQATSAPKVDFKTSLTRANVSDVITLTDLSSGNVADREWKITGPGIATAVSGNAQSAIYSFRLNNPGLYTIKYFVSNCVGTDSLVRTSLIEVFNYCIPTVSSVNSDFAITAVTVGDVNAIRDGVIQGINFTNITPAPGTVSYRDNVNQTQNYNIGDIEYPARPVAAYMELGSNVIPFSVSRLSTFNPVNIYVWIDFDQDGIFQASELAAESGTVYSKTYQGTLTISPLAKTGATRMRISTSFGNQGNKPCGFNGMGDFNDYRVVITPDVTVPFLVLQGKDTLFTEVGTSFIDPGAVATDPYIGDISSSIMPVSNVDVNSTGTYQVVYQVSDASGNKAKELIRTVIVIDTQAPVIDIQAGDTVYLEVFSSFTMPAVTVTDNYDTGLVYTLSGAALDTSLPGPYLLHFDASDLSGNRAATRVLTVVVKDGTAPVLVLTGGAVTISCADTLIPEPGFTVSDNYYPAGSLVTTAAYAIIKLNKTGSYTVRYYVTDPSGNTDSSVTREFRVVDSETPEITLNGRPAMDWNRWEPFIDPGYTVYDRCDASVTVIADYSNLDVDTEGTYTITYTSTDASGNKTEILRSVRIKTGLNNVAGTAGNRMEIYPNPAKDLLYIEAHGLATASISVFDVNGKLVLFIPGNSTLEAKTTIGLGTLSPGLYLVKITSATFSASQKVIVQK